VVAVEEQHKAQHRQQAVLVAVVQAQKTKMPQMERRTLAAAAAARTQQLSILAVTAVPALSL
jgi:hypothetical protein